ncbi:hypothetical protein GKE82_18025 [Conexibacter sp. W3-3-2]|uniref:hypothetical protein n=1 Tax=Conexibacter sp. W3-3-2 TaxID=2675227 RepID=UPI0012B97CDA|nr:hypothetical protein [Conexibacter sp. W3-3-2]MTD46130.1 hypothetical protein [Conexibacter sp. W3-3-2]
MSTVLNPPPGGTPPSNPAAHGHRSGTVLDDAPRGPQVAMPGALVSFGLFLALAVVYFLIGYKITIDQHVIVFDALDRLTRAYLVWHNDPPKLAAIGFVFAPLTTFAMLPFALVKPLATSLIALPLMSAVFAAGTIVILDRTLARCDMNAILRLPLLALFAFNPFWVFYAGNGMSEVIYAFFLAFSLYCFVSWYATTEPRFLIGAGFGIAVLVLTRYAFIVWAVLLAVLIAVALVRRRASKIEVEGSVIAFAAPVVYVLALWILFNTLIVGDPFGWITNTTTSTQAVNATGIDTSGDLTFNEIARRLLELNVTVFPLAFVVVPALVLTFVAQRNDMALWLASFVVLGIVIMGGNAYINDQEGLLTLRDSMPMYVAAFVGAAWVFRSFETARVGVWAATVALLVINLFTAWSGMQSYPFQSLEQAFVRAVKTGDDQTGVASRGGFRGGVLSEAQMAGYINRNVTRNNAILTDNAKTFGVIILSGRPQLFFDRIDKGDTRFRQVLDNPWGTVDYVLLTINPSSGDLVQQKYPRANDGLVRGLTAVARTERYLLLRVARTNPARRRTAARTPATAGAAAAPSATPAATPTPTPTPTATP